MPVLSCLHCGAETSNGLVLCELCQRKVTVDLEFVPVYFRNLARWRPGRSRANSVPGSRVLYDGVDVTGTGDRISDALDGASNALTTWARALADDRPHLARLLDRLAAAREAETVDEPQAVAWVCRGFTRHLVTVATLDWAGEFVREVGTVEARLRELTETLVPGWYAGACKRRITMEATCGAPTYVVPGLTWVTCAQCGVTTYVEDHLEVILDEARDWTARPMRIAEAVVALVDAEHSVPRLYERIKKWEQRERLSGLRRLDEDGDPVGPKHYRLGDVLDLLNREGATRLAEADAEAS